MATIEDIKKRLADRRAVHDKARDEQEAIDLQEIDAIEEARGEPLRKLTMNGFKVGVPVKAAYRVPSKPEYKRCSDLASRAVKNNDQAARREAQEQLALACLVYPPAGDSRNALLDASPGVLLSIYIEASKIAEGRDEEEGKG